MVNAKPLKKKRRVVNGEKIYQIVIVTIISLIVLICLYPLLYILSASLMSADEWNARMGVFLIPHKPTLEAYRVVLEQVNLYKAFGVSVSRAVVGAVTGVFMNAVTGYTLSRKKIFGKKVLSVFLFITMIYGGGFIPTYIIIAQTNLLNSFWVYIIPGLLDAWTALVFRQNFLNTPSEIEESARVDGASEIQIFFRIMLPINMPTVSVMLLFAAVSHWNAWFDSMMFIDTNNSSLIPLQLYLKNAFASTGGGTTGLVIHAETQKMVVAVIGILPILCIYPFFQKYFTKGIYSGSVKG